MSEAVPISAPLPSAGPAAQAGSGREKRRHLLAAFVSAIVPGIGQIFLGERRKATVLLIVLSVLLIGFWPLRLLRFYSGFVALYCTWIALYLYAVASALVARSLPRSERPSRWWLIATLPLTFLSLSLLGGALMRASGFRSFSIPSTSMEKTLRQGDHFLVDTHSRLPARQDVVIFIRDQIFFVKRAVAIDGDSIEGKDGVIFVDGKAQDQPYVEHVGAPVADWMNDFGPITIPNGKCFVMGDNRNVSLDSRSPEFGLVDDSSIIGKPLYVFGSDGLGRSIR